MAGVLTLNLVLQKAKVDDIRRVQKLNVCAAQLQDIGVVRSAINLEVLSLSLNEITELGAISNCRHLRELYLRKNQIRDINQVLHLTRLYYLEVLNLSDNPISRDPNYRRFVIAAVPSLDRLDDIDIADEERAAAVRVFPELTRFAPPPSRYAEPPSGAYTAPAPSAPPRQPPAKHRTGSSFSAQSSPPPRLGVQSETTPSSLGRPHSGSVNGSSGANGGAARRQSAAQGWPPADSVRSRTTSPGKGSYQPLSVQTGPSEPGVVQAVKVLCSELSPEGLQEVRRFIDSMSSY